jgi:Ethanolamine utilization protein EutJ (predicted chaperonin)
MDGPAAQWWDGWKKRQEKAHGLVIELWDETKLVKKLLSPEGDQVRRAYYEPFTAPPAPAQEQIRLVLDVEEEAGCDARGRGTFPSRSTAAA